MIAKALRVTLAGAAIAVLLWVMLIAAPMWLTRWRMSRLLADYHGIYPTQSTWADAQRLMARWGKWGRYEGTCTATDCSYTILIDDPISRQLERFSDRQMSWFYASHLPVLAGRAGWHSTRFYLSFIVQDGRILQTNQHIGVETIDLPWSPYTFQVGISAKTTPTLHRSERTAETHQPWIVGNDEQLDIHPNYKAGRPNGCEGCEFVEISYTSQLEHDQLVQLTSYNLNCITRVLHLCKKPSDLLDAAKPWHFYESIEGEYPAGSPPMPCHTETRALARDAVTILEVETLPPISSFKEFPDDDATRELIQARVLRIWKEPLPGGIGPLLQVAPYSGESEIPPYRPPYPPEDLEPGQRALLFLFQDGPTDFGPDRTPRIVAYELGRCGVLEDSPENLAAIKRGIAQDVPYRHPEPFGD